MNDQEGCADTQIIVDHNESGTREARLILNGQPVSRVVIIPMLMRIGAAIVRMDGVGGVETVEAFRHRGYAGRLMQFVIDEICAGDAALSTLFGIEDFYQKFGYDTVGPEYTVTMPFANASPATLSLPGGWQCRSLALADLPAVMSLYHANTRHATGALVRHDAGVPQEAALLGHGDSDALKVGQRAWNRLRRIADDALEDACRLLIDHAGQVAGYAWRGRGWFMDYRRRDMPEAFHLAEAMARDPAAADALLAACRLWSTDFGEFTKMAFAIPPEGPLAAAATYEGGEVFAVYTRGGDFMGRVLDLNRLIQQLLPELSASIQTTRVPFCGCLTLRTELAETFLSITPNGVSRDASPAGKHLTAELPQAALARLCLGGLDPADVLARLPQSHDPETTTLLRALFPRRHPHIYPMDRF